MTLDILDRPTPPLGFHGRASRRDWWIAVALVVCLPVPTILLSWKLTAIVWPIAIVNLIATTVRRAHDVDIFGLLPVLSLSGPAFLIMGLSYMAAGNEAMMAPLLLSVLTAAQLFELATKKGTAGPNRFGERTW